MKNLFKYLLLTTYLISNSLFAGEGGVDVGNFSKVIIPGANIVFNAPKNWEKILNKKVSIIISPNKSIIKASLANFNNNQLSTSKEILNYLNEISSKRYMLDNINDLNVVSFTSKDELTRELYVVSPTKEVAFLEVNIKTKDIKITNKILSKIFFEYQGVAANNSKDETVLLEFVTKNSYEDIINDKRKSCIQFSNYKNKYNCFGSYVGASYKHDINIDDINDIKRKDILHIGTSGYDTGKIIDLGLSKNDYENIFIQNNYLVLPKTQVDLEQIYSTFNPNSPTSNLESAELKEGHIYLIRTISWPQEDALFKMKINKVIPNKSVSITFKKLAHVPKKTLQKYVEYMNNYTLEVEAKREEGVVKLYDRTKWGSYLESTFNFYYGTRDNQYITYNGWDLSFDPGMFSASGTSHDRNQLFDQGKVGLESITIDNFPDPNTIFPDKIIKVKIGHTYLLMGYQSGSNSYTIWSAFEVLEVEPTEQLWVKIKWKKFKATRPMEDPFIHDSVLNNSNLRSTTIKSNEDFYPFTDFYNESTRCTVSIQINDKDIDFRNDIISKYYEFDGNLESINFEKIEPSKLKDKGPLDRHPGRLQNYNLNQVYIFKLRSLWEEYILALEIKKKDKDKIQFDYKLLNLKLAAPGYCESPPKGF